MTNSCQKGKRNERLWAAFLKEHGFEARRGCQFQGSPDSPDVVCPDLDHIHWEVKAVEKLNVRRAMTQATNDAGQKMPIVAHKTNNTEWLITMKATDLMKLIDKDWGNNGCISTR